MAIEWSTRASSSMAMQSVVRSPPAAAVLLGERDAEQPELAHGPHDVDREVVVAVPRLGVRARSRLGEVADDLAQRLVLLGELDVHGCDGLPGRWNG